MTPQTISALPVSFDAYIRHGWSLVPIPQGSKGPRLAGWNKQENCLKNSAYLPHGYGVGLAHAYSGTMALDIDHWDEALRELGENGIDLQQLFDAPDAVTVNSGMPGHGKLLYSMPFGSSLPSKKLIATAPDGHRFNYLDFRCGTIDGKTCQDLLPPTIHPITQQPYQWGGRGRWEHLPTIPMPLLVYWQSLLTIDKSRNIGTGGKVDTSWEEIQQALSHIDPSVSRDEWVSVGMALHYAGHHTEQLEQALHIWNEWSMISPKYKGEGDIIACWNSFKPSEDGVKVGTLFHIAGQYGWKRPTPDVSSMFKSITPAEPHVIQQVLAMPAPQVNIDLFPSVLSRRSREIAVGIGCNPMTPLWAGLSAVSGAIDKRTRLELMPGWEVPPILWMMTIGDPAEKKTPGSKPMFEPLKAIEVEDAARYGMELLKWEAFEAAHIASKKNYLQVSASSESLGTSGTLDTTMLPIVTALPPKPVPLRLIVSDITSQRLVRMTADRPRGMLCYLDEMRTWIDKLLDKNSGENGSAWTVGYEGNAYHMDRVGSGNGEGSVQIPNFAFAMYGNVQPGVLKSNIERMATDGTLQRFIPAILPPIHYPLGQPVPKGEDNTFAWEMMIRQIYALPVTRYTLSPDAYTAFRSFQSWYNDRKQQERLMSVHPSYMTAFGKIEGSVGRIILIMHIMTTPYELQVSEDTTNKAITFARDYLIPALRYLLDDSAGVTGASLEHWMMQHIIQISGEQSSVTLRDLKRSAKRRIGETNSYLQDRAVEDALHPLEQAGWLIHTKEGKSDIYLINPALSIQFHEHRMQVIKAKQERRDDFHRTSGGKIPRILVKGYNPETMD